MLFSSGVFIYLFLPTSVLGYQIVSRFGRRSSMGWLALTSLVFYGCWRPVYLLLLLFSVLLNFGFSLGIAQKSNSEKARSRWLLAGICGNLLLLMWFKYLFPVLSFLHEHNLLSRDFGSVVLPLGISFFTFTQIAYLIDLRQGIAARQDLLSYVVFVTFFPHLIAGPIIHPREIMPQLERESRQGLHLDDVTLGFSWFILGLAKKVLIADAHFGWRADALYLHPRQFGAAASWIGTLSYAMQLYFDFSGYSDMALGLARMFSIEFPFNFDSPYKARSIIDFWQRWHMTLTRYLGEYLYTPILRVVNSYRMDHGKKVNRKAQATLGGYVEMVVYPVFTTMFIAGIWHGAGIQFLIFGSLHGVYLCMNHAWRLLSAKGSRFYGKLPVSVSVLLVFLGVLLANVFFRAHDVHEADYVVGSMLGLHAHGMNAITTLPRDWAVLGAALFIVWAMPNTQEILGQMKGEGLRLPSLMHLHWKPSAVWSLGLAAVLGMSILLLDGSGSFLYFQF